MIYVCIPAHDEERSIGVVLWKIRNVMRDFGREYEILVLDDASEDDTPAVLERYAAFLPLTVLRTGKRVGHGPAVERLLREAVRRAPYPKRDVAVVLQADFSEDPAAVEDLIKILEGGADVVAGVEEPEGGQPERWERILRRAAPILLGRALQNAPVSDPLSGIRAYRIVVLKKALRGEDRLLHESGRWGTNLRLLDAVAPYARRIEESPMKLRHELRPRASRFRPLRTARDLLRLRGQATWSGEAGAAEGEAR